MTRQQNKQRAQNEGDADEDEEEFAACDWCKGTVRSDEDRELLMIFDEDVCRNCVRESDLEMTSSGQYDYPAGQFADSENASVSKDGAGSDTTVIYLTDSEDEAEAQLLYDGKADRRAYADCRKEGMEI